MYNEGVRIGNGYDKEPEPIVPAWEQKKKSKVKSFDLHPDIPMSERHNFDLANNPIRSVTVQAINLVPQDTPRQIDMFMDAAKQDKLERMEKCVEEIRRRFGKDSIRNGVLCQNLRLPPEKAEITMPTGMVG